MAEFALIFPVIIFLLLSFVDFARYFYYRGVATSSAHHGISLGQIITGLERIPVDPATGQPDPNLPEVQAVNERTLRLMSERMGVPVKPYGSTDPMVYIIDPGTTNATFLPTLRLPNSVNATPPRDLETALRQDPLQVNFQIHVGSISPWFSGQNFNITAAGYRELGPEPANPPPMDCHGNLITNPNAPPPNNCPCPGDESAPIVRNAQGVCICVPTGQAVNSAQECVCPAPKYYDPILKKCVCPGCPGTGQNQNSNCACSCPPCSTFDPPQNACVCNTATCNENQYRQGCCCKPCPGMFTNPNGSGCDTCPDSARDICARSGQILNPTSCKCEGCPNLMTSPNGKECTCPGEVISNVSQYCNPNQRLDKANCVCLNCAGARVQDPTGFKCVCPNKIIEETCKKKQTEDPSWYWDNVWCACKQCDLSVRSIVGGRCVCDVNKAYACNDKRWVNSGSCCAPCPGQGTVSKDNLSCECNIDPETLKKICLRKGEIPDPSAAVCGCRKCPKAPQVFNGEACVCPNKCDPGQIQSDKDCSCQDFECPENTEPGSEPGTCICTLDCENRPGGGTTNQELCTCTCPSGTVPDPVTGYCMPPYCIGANCYWDNGQWQLPPE